MKVSALTHIGYSREKNEDNYLCDDGKKVFAVADGMGGHNGGETASRIAIEEIVCHSIEEISDLENLFISINKKLIELGSQEEDLEGMGTTLSLALFKENSFIYSHIGDTRIYLVRDHKIKQVTRDHTMVNELLAANEITIEESFEHPYKNVLTRALGVEEEVKVDLGTVAIEAGDIILICSDGLYNYVSEEDFLRELIEKENDIELVNNSLLEKALSGGGRDNITSLLIQYEGKIGE